ncbi:MAG: hypothetical protein ACKVQW_09640 [Pyrinomonadaceae bacterium]
MIRKEDVERLISANARVQEILAQKPKGIFGMLRTSPRKAARVLCDELAWMVHDNAAYWETLQEAGERLRVYREQAPELLNQIGNLVEKEQAVFRRLGINDAQSEAVISQVYSALRITKEYDEPSRDALANLKDRLAHAQELICKAARGRLSRVYDKVIGRKGAQVLAGGAVAGANVAILIVDQGVVSWVSLVAGFDIMRGDVKSLIKTLCGE